MKILQEDAILIFKKSICQSGMAHKGCCVNFLTRVGHLEASIDCWTEATTHVQMSGNQEAADRVWYVVMEDIVLSQKNKPKRHWLACEISRETGIPCSSSSSNRNSYTRRSKTVSNAPQSQLNKWVFSSFLNWPTVVSDWRSEAGRLFQSLGPATWKAQSPKPVWVRGTTQVETSDERSRRRPTSETSWQSSDK